MRDHILKTSPPGWNVIQTWTRRKIPGPRSYTASSTGSKFRPSTTKRDTYTITSVNYCMPFLSQTMVDSSAQSLIDFWQRRLTVSRAAARIACRTLLTDVISWYAIIFSPYHKSTWNELLSFASAITSKLNGRRKEKYEQLNRQTDWSLG